jgi:hypothetical protein
MKRLISKSWIALFIFLIGAFHTAQAQELDASLVQQLLGNRYTDKTWTQRERNIKQALSTLKQQGVIGVKPAIRYDYEDIYRVRKPLLIKGVKPVLLIHDYQIKYVGCCSNNGIALIFEDDGNNGEIQAFAKKNWCAIWEHEEPFYEPHMKFRKEDRRYLRLNCQANNASDFELGD